MLHKGRDITYHHIQTQCQIGNISKKLVDFVLARCPICDQAKYTRTQKQKKCAPPRYDSDNNAGVGSIVSHVAEAATLIEVRGELPYNIEQYCRGACVDLGGLNPGMMHLWSGALNANPVPPNSNVLDSSCPFLGSLHDSLPQSLLHTTSVSQRLMLSDVCYYRIMLQNRLTPFPCQSAQWLTLILFHSTA